MQRTCLGVLLLLILAFALPAFPQNGNGAPNGAHYNLNIIGVEDPKNDPMTGSDRHTIFVALGSRKSAVTSNIYLTPGDFRYATGMRSTLHMTVLGTKSRVKVPCSNSPAIPTYLPILPARQVRLRRHTRSGVVPLANRADR